ncbi:DapH/DapD/GlmU-related protein [uncultured Roseovarius sp.]
MFDSLFQLSIVGAVSLTLSGGGTNAGIGISLGDNCVAEAGLYVTRDG